MRCESCQKFASLEMQEPEVLNLEVDDEGEVLAEVRIVRSCADCGAEMKEASLEATGQVDLKACTCTNEKREMSVTGEDTVEALEEGGSRYQKSYYGFELTATVKCETCGAKGEVVLRDKVAASEMEEIS